MIKTTKEIKQEPILNDCRIQKERDSKLWADVEELKKEIENFKVENKGITNKAYNEALQDVLKLLKRS